jgi:hypothetical protein
VLLLAVHYYILRRGRWALDRLGLAKGAVRSAGAPPPPPSRFPPWLGGPAPPGAVVGQGVGGGHRGSLPGLASLGPMWIGRAQNPRAHKLWMDQVLPVGSPSYRISGCAVGGGQLSGGRSPPALVDSTAAA